MVSGARRRGARGQSATVPWLAALSISALLFHASLALAQHTDRSDWGSTRQAPRTLDVGGVSLSAFRVGRWGETSTRSGFGLDIAGGFRTVGHAPFFGASTLYGLGVHQGGWALSYTELVSAGVQLGPAVAQTLVGAQLLGARKLCGPARLVLPSPTVGLALGFAVGDVALAASLRRTYEWRFRDADLLVTSLSLSVMVTSR